MNHETGFFCSLFLFVLSIIGVSFSLTNLLGPLLSLAVHTAAMSRFVPG